MANEEDRFFAAVADMLGIAPQDRAAAPMPAARELSEKELEEQLQRSLRDRMGLKEAA